MFVADADSVSNFLSLCNILIPLQKDVGTPRPDTISPIPENIALLEAEKIAREREPGDGTKQRWVVEQIEAAMV
ncbi:MAG: hypothetical protein B6D41_10305 [Chloroflexi bacterium UTCFX4]|nr:MAG: hypothetical protein B6D41_10305 [Chloroflexi bacterium UTCFX4]